MRYFSDFPRQSPNIIERKKYFRNWDQDDVKFLNGVLWNVEFNGFGVERKLYTVPLVLVCSKHQTWKLENWTNLGIRPLEMRYGIWRPEHYMFYVCLTNYLKFLILQPPPPIIGQECSEIFSLGKSKINFHIKERKK